METQFRINGDIPGWLSLVILTLVVAAIARLVAISYTRKASIAFIATGAIGYVLLSMAALRPEKLVRHGRAVGPKIIVLVDGSRRLQIQSKKSTRVALARSAVGSLVQHFRSTRVSVATFGEGAAKVLKSPDSISESLGKFPTSDLVAALNSVMDISGERPAAIVVVSDGRLTRPYSVDAVSSSSIPSEIAGIPIHSVNVGGEPQPDASIRSIDSLGEAIAHQPLSLKVEVACSGGMQCGKIPVTIRTLERGVPAHEISTLVADLSNRESQVLDFDVVLEHSGSQLLEVALTAQSGDKIPENDTRLLPFLVSRDRLRLLHIAGCPSYDVRELRRWLKGNAAVDLVSFFILRTDEDNPNTEDNAGELSLIPFPVDELFSQHLPSFDAVILQDIDAARYHLDIHLERLARYVEEGGGLILVGGPSAFSGGSYVHSALERVLPTTLVVSRNPYDSVEFVPKWTTAATQAPVMGPLRRILGDRLPSFAGANTLGPPKPGAMVLWEHPQRTFLPVKGVAMSGPMPVLAISDVRDGRVIELGLDATYRLAWGNVAAETSGRAYGALWEALIGWVMHEQQYAPLRGEVVGDCVASLPVVTKWYLPADVHGLLNVDVERLGQVAGHASHQQVRVDNSRVVELQLGALPPGGYTAMARVEGGAEARLNFACELGGTAFADSRPDPKRMLKLSEVSGGVYATPADLDRLPLPPSFFVDLTRTSHPIVPGWLWSALAAAFLGTHWLLARSAGFR